MSFITKIRKQKMVYWSRSGDAQPDGEYLYSAPVEILCRWEDTQEEFIDPQGGKQMSSSVLYVGVELRPGDIVRLGPLSELVDQVDPTKNPGWRRVRQFSKLPNLKVTEYLRRAYL